jgi:hypothetical protein
MVRKLKATAFLFIFLILCLAVALPIVKADPAKPNVYVDPKDNKFTTDTTSVGTNFTVSIKAADFTQKVYSYELKLSYDNSMLEAVEAKIPDGHWLTPTLDPDNIYVVERGKIHSDEGYVGFAATLVGDEPGATGSGTIATVKFSITKAPTTGNLTCSLELKPADFILVDPNATTIPQDQYDIVDGNYVFSVPPPPPGAKPKIYVDPKDNIFSTSSKPVGSNFTISIKAANWTEPGVYSYEFKLFYNSSMLEAVEAVIPDGHWLTPTLSAGNISKVDPGTINQTEGYVSFAATLLGEEPGKIGNGTISTITFKITEAPPTDQTISCSLEIVNATLRDPDGTQIPSDQYDVVNGNYEYSAAAPSAKTEDLNGDGQVNIEDVAIWGLAFGSVPGHPRWNPIADVDDNEVINVIDAVLICKAWTG